MALKPLLPLPICNPGNDCKEKKEDDKSPQLSIDIKSDGNRINTNPPDPTFQITSGGHPGSNDTTTTQECIQPDLFCSQEDIDISKDYPPENCCNEVNDMDSLWNDEDMDVFFAISRFPLHPTKDGKKCIQPLQCMFHEQL